ncbi:MAG: metallophosphoesterase family protein [Dehalococcoidia bacterium]
MRIGVLSDTHLPSEVPTLDELGAHSAEFLASMDLIIHAGDVVLPSVLDWCAQFAPVVCAQGNHDHFHDDRMSSVVVVEHEGWRIGAVHDVEGIPPYVNTVEDLKRVVYNDTSLDILVAGDSHYERLEYRDSTLLLDSGSPIFPHHKSTRLGSMALIEVTRDGVRAEIVPLGETAERPNPCTHASMEFDRGGLMSASIGGAAQDLETGHVRWRPRAAPPLRV